MLTQPKHSTGTLATHVFRLETNANHPRQAKAFMDFCHHYKLQFINPSSATVCYYIIYVTRRFTVATSVRNYVSGVKFLYMQLGLILEALDSFPVNCLLRTADLTLLGCHHCTSYQFSLAYFTISAPLPIASAC